MKLCRFLVERGALILLNDKQHVRLAGEAAGWSWFRLAPVRRWLELLIGWCSSPATDAQTNRAKDETIGIEAIYEKIAGGKYGCSWDAFQAYKHLKSLGYIVGRHGVPWTMKNSGTCDTTVPPSVVHTDQSFNRIDGTCSDITKLLKEMHIDGISPSFEVYLPNSKFKKSSPGAPSFLLYLLR